MEKAKENKTEQYRQRMKTLREDAETWRSHWKELSQYMQPRRGRYLDGDTQDKYDGSKVHEKIINSAALDSIRTIASGLQGGLTSPSRPWFSLATADEDLNENTNVREWLHLVRNMMLNVLSRSNFYGSIHNVYRELAVFGTGSNLMEEDLNSVIRCRPFTVGEYFLSLDSSYRPDGLYRQYAMTAAQMIEEFGMDAVSEAVRSTFKANDLKKKFEVVHIIERNKFRDPNRIDAKGQAYNSIYYDLQDDHDKILRFKGYKSKPFVAPRWEVSGTETYGSCPGMDALGDVKMIQKMEEKKLKAIDKEVDPTMNAPASMKGKGGTLVAGGINFVDVTQGGQSFTPAYQVRMDIRNVSMEIERIEQRIKRCFYNDLFLAVLGNEKTMTATEIAKSYEEKLMMLGPVIERLQSELHDPTLERLYSIMSDLGMLPPAPKELQGQQIKIQYISILAQAQKMVGVTAIEQTVSFVGNLAGVRPDIIDKLDFDEAVDQYADMVGAPPKLIRSDDVVAKIREEKAKQQQAQMAQQQLMAGAQGAKVLSETDMGGNNALNALMGNMVQ